MKLRLVLATALGSALVALPTTALGSSSHVATNTQTFPDSVGEDAQAPDITSVVVSNDDAGAITFKVNLSNRPSLTSDMQLLLFMNTDGKTTTGDPNSLGADYAIELDPGSVLLGQWNGTAYATASSQASLTYSYDATGATIHISASDLGGAKTISFAVIALSGIVTDAQGNPDFTNAHSDAAPDPGHGFFTYKVIAKVTLKLTAFTTTPAKAGKKLSASLAANQSDTGGPVAAGKVSCKGLVGTVRVAATHTLRHGVASCNWNLPKTAKGKLFHGTVSIATQGATLTKSFSARIR